MNEFAEPLPMLDENHIMRYLTPDDGLAFWQRLGFVEIERRPPRLFGAKVSATLILRRSMSDKATASS